DFENAPTPTPQPTPPTPTPKKDEAIVSGVKINKDENNIATIEITFSKLVLANDNKKSFILEVKDSTNANNSPIVATELVLDKNKKTLVGKLNNLKTNVDYKISKLTLNNQNVEFDENALLKSYVDQAKLTMTFNNTNKKVNVKLENFSVLNSLEDKQPILVFDIEITKKNSNNEVRVVHKSLTKSQLLNSNGLEINLKDTNGSYTVKLTNAKLLNINI
ncbi:DUF1410 domain-containing protein, partial [Ureaplasma urealyticum]